MQGSLEELSKLLSNLNELNLAFNLIRDWQVVVDVLSALPELEILNLSGNQFLRNNSELKLPTPDAQLVSGGLKTLVLNECNINWKQVLIRPLAKHSSLSELVL